MLSLVMYDDKSYSELYLNKNGENYSLNGFTIKNNKVDKFDKKYLEIFECFKMTNNIEKVGKDGEYDIILDKEYGLYHFFKNGKEDFIKLFYYNTRNDVLNSNKINFNLNEEKCLRSFITRLLGFSVSINLIFFPFLIYKTINEQSIISYSVEYNDDYVPVEKNRLFDTISYTFNENDYKFADDIKKEIKNLIFTSKNLNEIEKEFLYNEELINLVYNYYKGTNADVLSLIKHTDIKIESFKEDEKEGSAGYYADDNVLHILNYDIQNIINKEDQCRDLAHEYIHLLQTRSSFMFVKESSAEIMSHEFYLKSSSSKDVFSYKKACKYLKVFMEIIGSEPILETNFDMNSDLLVTSVQSYLDEKELEEFIYILNLSPFYDEEELENGKYDRLYELLGIIYNNKFGKDISEDRFIKVIMDNGEYNRVYFSESLRNNNEEYFIDVKEDAIIYNLLEAKEYGIIDVIYKRIVTEEEYNDINIEGLRVINFNYKDGINGEVYYSQNGYICQIYLENGSILELPLDVAEERGYVTVDYIIQRHISSDEFMNNFDTILNDDNYLIYNKEGYVFDNTRMFIYSIKDLEKVSIESLQPIIKNNHKLS